MTVASKEHFQATEAILCYCFSNCSFLLTLIWFWEFGILLSAKFTQTYTSFCSISTRSLPQGFLFLSWYLILLMLFSKNVVSLQGVLITPSHSVQCTKDCKVMDQSFMLQGQLPIIWNFEKVTANIHGIQLPKQGWSTLMLRSLSKSGWEETP